MLFRSYGITVGDVLAATDGFNSNAAGGSIYDYGNEYIVKANINTADCEALGQAVVRSDERGTITLADIAVIEQAGRLPRIGLASLRTEPAVILTVTKQNGTDTRSLTEAIDRQLETMALTLPSDVKISTDIFRQDDFIESSVRSEERRVGKEC